MKIIDRPSSFWSSFMSLQHLRLHHDVEGGRRLVGDHERRAARERHRDHHALLLTARQLVRVVVDPARRQAHLLQQRADADLRLLLARLAVDHDRLGDLIADPRWTGFSACRAPWKTIEAPAQRTARRRPGFIVRMSSPVEHGSRPRPSWSRECSRRMAPAIVDLPQPDSPASPRTSPLLHRHVTPRTAGTAHPASGR